MSLHTTNLSNEQVYEQLTLFPEDSHANHFPWLESKKVKGTTVTYGRKCSELSEKLSRLGYLVRTYLESCELPGKQFVRTWSVRDTLSPYLILKLRLSEQRTEEKESSLWPTVRTGTNRNSRNAIIGKNTNGKHKSDMGLEQAVEARMGIPPKELKSVAELPPRFQKMWPTPTTRDYKDGTAKSCENVPVNGLLGRAVHMWPTPRAGRAGRVCKEYNKDRGADLEVTMAKADPSTIGGQLNPTFAEYLMNFPKGWTSLD